MEVKEWIAFAASEILVSMSSPSRKDLYNIYHFYGYQSMYQVKKR
jgi:hypothetical protein